MATYICTNCTKCSIWRWNRRSVRNAKSLMANTHYSNLFIHVMLVLTWNDMHRSSSTLPSYSNVSFRPLARSWVEYKNKWQNYTQHKFKRQDIIKQYQWLDGLGNCIENFNNTLRNCKSAISILRGLTSFRSSHLSARVIVRYHCQGSMDWGIVLRILTILWGIVSLRCLNQYIWGIVLRTLTTLWGIVGLPCLNQHLQG